MKQIKFDAIPVIACIPAITAGGRAFINLSDALLNIGDESIVLPAFFISDGMSVPSIADGVIEPTDGITAGHIHDMLYSGQCAEECNKIAAALEIEDPREAADEVFGQCMESISTNFNRAEETAAKLAVRMFGGRHFRKYETDQWRKEVAGKIGGILVEELGNGLGKGMMLADVWKMQSEVVCAIGYATQTAIKAQRLIKEAGNE